MERGSRDGGRREEKWAKRRLRVSMHQLPTRSVNIMRYKHAQQVSSLGKGMGPREQPQSIHGTLES